MNEKSFSYKDFSFKTTSSCIASQPQLDLLKTHLPSLPDMLFLDNSLQINYKSKPILLFNAADALERVELTSRLKVKHAWNNKECIIRDYDWTFNPLNYTGSNLEFNQNLPEIDKSFLYEKDEIFMYDSVLLYQDELDDNGFVSLSVKLRVMKDGFLVLLRYFRRVDGVILGIRDVRYVMSFAEGILERRVGEQECEWEAVPFPRTVYGVDYSVVADQEWVVGVLGKDMPERVHCCRIL